jgi:hypothetical protein
LDKETSRSTRPGPVRVLRLSLPNRVLNLGGVKHWSLTY